MTNTTPNRGLPDKEPSPLPQRYDPASPPRSNPLLRNARRTHLWSQADLAERLGVAKETISRWENGVSQPQPQQFARLCEVFQTTPQALGYGLEEPEQEPASEQGALHTRSSAEPAPQPATSLPAARPLVSRRRLLIAGGIVLGGLTLAGSSLAWLIFRGQPASSSSQQPASPRHWPIAAYDLHHHTRPARVAQWMLQARQYDLGPTGVDGVFGPITQAAVKAFQKDQHLPVDGIVGNATWERLILPSDPTSRGSQVKALQECLQQTLHLVPALTIDGEFGPQTAAALRRFRQQEHLPIKEVADLDTWCLLLGGRLR